MNNQWVPALTLLVLVGCGATAEEGELASEAEAEEFQVDQDVEQLGSELASNQQCDTIPAHKTLTRGGQFEAKAKNPEGCPDSYLVDLNQYDKGYYNLGTSVAYSDTSPTTKAECERTRVTALVWRRNANGSTTYLGTAKDQGTWIPAGFWIAHCEVPNVNIDSLIANYANGGNYRIGIRAQLDTADGSSYTKRNFFFSTDKLH